MAGDTLALVLFGLRIGLNTAALLTIGLAFYAVAGLLRPRGVQQLRVLIVAAAVAAAVFSILRLPLLNLQMGDTSTFFDPDLTALGLQALGASILAFVAGAGCAIGGAVTGSRALFGAAAAIAAAGFALTGHTQALAAPNFAPAAVAVHAAIASFWVAAPLVLWPRAALSHEELLARLKRFSVIAIVAIPIMVLVGAGLAWALAGGAEGLVGTLYGQLLVLKFLAALAALGLGAINHRIVTAKVAAAPGEGRAWLRITLGIEMALFAIAILAVSAATTLTGAGEQDGPFPA